MPSLVKRNSYQGDGRGPKERGAEERRSETGSVSRGQGGSHGLEAQLRARSDGSCSLWLDRIYIAGLNGHMHFV